MELTETFINTAGEGTRVMMVDPDIRAGTRCAFLDDTGKYLARIVIHIHKVEEAKKLILEGIRRYDIQHIAINSGSGGGEAQKIINSVIADNNLEALCNLADMHGPPDTKTYRRDDDGMMYTPFAAAFSKSAVGTKN